MGNYPYSWELESWKKEKKPNDFGVGWYLLIVAGLMLWMILSGSNDPKNFGPVPLVPSAQEQAAIDAQEADYWEGMYCSPYDC